MPQYGAAAVVAEVVAEVVDAVAGSVVDAATGMPPRAAATASDRIARRVVRVLLVLPTVFVVFMASSLRTPHGRPAPHRG
ncbi:hypothetical protein GCM10025782_03950 [Pedococcus ginsenosidimutans]|uniref:RDD domain-containing protein n=1 Tax=Pedococcus ginsenosidimutans TaxID=490570 RepID=A0ABP8XQV7_9MICO